MSHPITTETDAKIEEVLNYIYENSWLNIVDLEGWAVGLADNSATAEEWCKSNAKPGANHFKAWDLGTTEAAKMKDYFSKLSMPACAGSGVSGKFLYIYKFSL